MNLPHPFARLAAAAAVALCATLAATGAAAQSWEYKSYKRIGPGNQYDKDNFIAGTIQVEPKGEQWAFRMIAGKVDVCYRGALPAVVNKTEELTTIEVSQPVPGCEAFRYTIRNDGSGGFKEVLEGEQWRRTRFDHGLTPKK